LPQLGHSIKVFASSFMLIARLRLVRAFEVFALGTAITDTSYLHLNTPPPSYFMDGGLHRRAAASDTN
jgi:hypothetical protein